MRLVEKAGRIADIFPRVPYSDSTTNVPLPNPILIVQAFVVPSVESGSTALKGAQFGLLSPRLYTETHGRIQQLDPLLRMLKGALSELSEGFYFWDPP